MKILVLLLLLVPIMAYGDNHVSSEISNPVNTLGLEKQIMITSDMTNKQQVPQHFAYLTQISLSWLTGSLSPNQSLSPAQSWIPTEKGIFEIEVFVWESLDNPDALSPPLRMTIQVVDKAA